MNSWNCGMLFGMRLSGLRKQALSFDPACTSAKERVMLSKPKAFSGDGAWSGDDKKLNSILENVTRDIQDAVPKAFVPVRTDISAFMQDAMADVDRLRKLAREA